MTLNRLLRLTLLASASCIVALPALAQETSAPERARTIERKIDDEMVYRVSLGKVEDVKILLRKTKNPNQVDNLGWPLLTIAAARADELALPMTKLLVESGADVNFGGPNRNYPLMYAAQSGNADVVAYLIEHKASYRVKDLYGLSLVDYAHQSKDDEVIMLVESAVQEDVSNYAMAKSQTNLDRLVYAIAFNSCASQYFSYYYRTKQDPIPKDEQAETLKKYDEPIAEARSSIITLFKSEPRDIDDIALANRQAIFTVLENMVSNRWRRRQGVGSEEDMQKRCLPISEKYRSGILKKAADE